MDQFQEHFDRGSWNGAPLACSSGDGSTCFPSTSPRVRPTSQAIAYRNERSVAKTTSAPSVLVEYAVTDVRGASYRGPEVVPVWRRSAHFSNLNIVHAGELKALRDLVRIRAPRALGHRHGDELEEILDAPRILGVIHALFGIVEEALEHLLVGVTADGQRNPVSFGCTTLGCQAL